MADDRRSISGTVTTRNGDSGASVAYAMARDLWQEEHGRWPKASDLAFFHLVRLSHSALGAHGTDESYTRVHNLAHPR